MNKSIIKIKELLTSFFKKKSYGNVFGSFSGSSSSAGAVYKSYAYACINARAENVAKAMFYFYNDKTHKEITNHPFIDLLAKPNKYNQSFKEILHKISTSLDLYGNAYLYVSRGIRKVPVSLYFLPSKMVVPVLNQNLTAIDSYDYLIANKKLSYKPADIIHFSIPDPDNNLLGKATVSSFNHSGFNSPPLAANRK